jgi:hypothetical protein
LVVFSNFSQAVTSSHRLTWPDFQRTGVCGVAFSAVNFKLDWDATIETLEGAAFNLEKILEGRTIG